MSSLGHNSIAKFARAGLLALVAAVAVGGSQAAVEQSFPEVIRLPDGFQPEGIAIKGTTFYVGSIPTGAVYRGNLRTGRGAVLVRPREGRAAIGLALVVVGLTL